MREQNALPYRFWERKNLTAKDDVNNVGAGRAAKGANPFVRTNSKFCLIFIDFYVIILLNYNRKYNLWLKILDAFIY